MTLLGDLVLDFGRQVAQLYARPSGRRRIAARRISASLRGLHSACRVAAGLRGS